MTTESEPLDGECRVFTRYLLDLEASPYVLEKYREAHRVLPALAQAAPFDRALVRAAGRHPRWTGCADAYARHFAPRGLLRRKLIVLFAILETCAPSHRTVDAVGGGGRVSVWLGLVAAGTVAVVRLLAGLALCLPLRLRHGRGGR